MTRWSRVVAACAAAALLLVACSGSDEEPEGNDGIQEIEMPDESVDSDGQDGDPAVEDEPDDQAPDGSDAGDGSGEPQDGPEPDGNGSDKNGSDDGDPFAVPDEIDVAYVQSVFDELMRINSEHLQSLLSREVPSAIESTDIDTFEAVYGGPMLDLRRDEVTSLLFDEDSRERYQDDPGFYHFEVMDLYSVNEGCISAIGWWDLTEISTDPPASDLYISWVISERPNLDDEINSTGWVLWDQNPLVRGEESAPIPPDEWELIDLDEVLDVDCMDGE